MLASSLLIGVSIAAPVGPIGVLCIRRTLAHGRLIGLVSGLGAATADGLFGLIAAFGLSTVMSLLIDNAFWLQTGGGIFLLYLGIKTALAGVSEDAAVVKHSSGIGGAYASTFLLTVTNPMTILAFIGIFAGLGADVMGDDLAGSIIMISGVFIGSALWWLMLSGGVSLFRERLTTRWMLWINRLSGGIIILFAVRILWSAIGAN